MIFRFILNQVFTKTYISQPKIIIALSRSRRSRVLKYNLQFAASAYLLHRPKLYLTIYNLFEYKKLLVVGTYNRLRKRPALIMT